MPLPLPTSLRPALSAYADREARRFGNRLRFVRLFGSWARGEAHEESDIDVAVVVDGLVFAEWLLSVGDAADVALETSVFLSPFVVSGERFDELLRRERRIAADIMSEGILL